MRKVMLLVPLAAVLAGGGYVAYGAFAEPLDERRMECWDTYNIKEAGDAGMILSPINYDFVLDKCPAYEALQITELEKAEVCSQYRSDRRGLTDPRDVEIYDHLLRNCSRG